MENIYYFQLGDLLGVGMTFVVLGIGIAYGLSVLADVRDDFRAENNGATACGTNLTGGSGNTIVYTGCSVENNATEATLAAIDKIPTKLGLIVTVVLAAVIIGILVRYLFVRFS